MNLHQKIHGLRRHFAHVRSSTMLVIVAILLSISSVAATFYYVGSLNATKQETRIIREDLSKEQARRLADAEQRVRDLALQNKRIAAQVKTNRELIAFLQNLIRNRPDVFAGVTLPPSLGTTPVRTTNTTPRPTKPKPKPTKPKPHGNGQGNGNGRGANPPFVPAPETPGPTPAPANPIVDTVQGVVCLLPLTCLQTTR